MKTNDFTMIEAIDIQNQQLQEWQSVLKQEVYQDLRTWAKASNKKAKRPEDVMRGTYLQNYIGNYMMGYRPKPGYTS